MQQKRTSNNTAKAAYLIYGMFGFEAGYKNAYNSGADKAVEYWYCL